ncbi:MAG: tripartite tricarboxylate transporter substrate-binding protein [Betaproteobacteria bacterium]
MTIVRCLPKSVRCASARAAVVAGNAVVALVAVCMFGAQPLPARAALGEQTVTLVLSSAPGGGIDRMARLLAQRLSQQLHRNVIIENRPGGRSRLAADHVSKAPADGNMLLITTGTSTIDLAFDPRTRPNVMQDLVPVSLLAKCQIVLVVNPARQLTTVQALAARARAAPGTLNSATSGVISTMRIVSELFRQRIGADIVQIPYKAEVETSTAVVGDRVDMAFVTLPSVLPFVNSGQVRALAIAGAQRSPMMPGVPTLTESGLPGIEATVWYGLFAPAGTPADVVDALARSVEQASTFPGYRQGLAAMGMEPAPIASAAFVAMLRDEVVKFRAVIETTNIRPE